MALTFKKVKIPYRARTASGQAVQGAPLSIFNAGSFTAADVWATQESPIAETISQPLFSSQDGTFPGYVRPRRYDVYLGDGAAEVWDAATFQLPWRVVGETGNPGFQNSWVNFGSGYPPVAFSKDQYGVVRLRGVAKSGTVATAIFTLPVGARPVNPSATALIVPCASLTTGGNLTIDNTGIVKAPSAAGSNAFVPLNGVSFLAEA